MTHALPFAGHTQNSLLHVLLRSEHPLPLETIAEKLGVTKTAVRQHILALQQGGYVQTHQPETFLQRSRGRRAFKYELSPEGRELFTRQYALFSQKMIEQMRDTLGEKELARQMREIGKSLAGDFAHRMPKPAIGSTPSTETLNQLAALMRELGYDAELSGDNEITAHNCVYHQIAESCEAVCEIDLTLMQKLTGQKPVHSECMVRGGAACRFNFPAQKH